MATPSPPDHPYLSKGFEPIRFECDYTDLVIEGEAPKELRGSLYRIGPNPQFAPREPYNPLLGDGMIHAFHLRDGRVSYRNRWVRTQQWRQERAAGRALFATSVNPRDADPLVAGLATDGVANTHLIWHAGRLLALEEGHAPIEIDPVSLDTKGTWRFGDMLPGNMTAHPKIDPRTGELVFFANFPGRDFSGALELYVADQDGRLIQRERIQGPFAALVHDFAITTGFVIFLVCPLTVSVERADAGRPAVAWEPEKGTYLGVVRRRSYPSEAQWLRLPRCMAWHIVNAFEDGSAIYLDTCAQDAPAFPTVEGAMPDPLQLRQYLTRWRITLSGKRETRAEPLGGALSERLSDVVCEYPRIDDRYCGLPYRYGYVACCGGPGTGDLFHRAIGRFDHLTQHMEIYRPAEHCAVSEPVFVPRRPNSEEGDGYILAVVYDEARNRSCLAIFDARRLERGPMCRALLDHRVPMGFHGLWRPDA